MVRVACSNSLGEGCNWDPRRNELLWVDIEERKVHRLTLDGVVRVVELPRRASFVLPRSGEGFVVGFEDGIALSNDAFSAFEIVTRIEAELPQTRINDGAVDPWGGLVFGTYDERHRQPVGAIYRIAPDGLTRRLIGNVATTNGIAFSPASDVLYWTDSRVGRIRRFDISSGFEHMRELADLAACDVAPGAPDGAIVDAEGGYWSARVWGHCVVRLDAQGHVSHRLPLPTKGPTSVALGGPTLDTLFVTSVRVKHSLEELAEQPNAGDLFSCKSPVRGVPPRLALL